MISSSIDVDKLSQECLNPWITLNLKNVCVKLQPHKLNHIKIPLKSTKSLKIES